MFTIKANILNLPGKFWVSLFICIEGRRCQWLNVHKIVAFPSYVHSSTYKCFRIVEAYISENVNCSNFRCPISMCLISIYMFCDAVVSISVSIRTSSFSSVNRPIVRSSSMTGQQFKYMSTVYTSIVPIPVNGWQWTVSISVDGDDRSTIFKLKNICQLFTSRQFQYLSTVDSEQFQYLWTAMTGRHF
jgi:hypothetical protein